MTTSKSDTAGDREHAVGPPTIRFRNYMGDYDDLNEVCIVGPYADNATRNRELARLAALPGNHGDAEFEASTISGHAADCSVAPEKVAGVTTLREFCSAFFGWTDVPDDDTEDSYGDVHPDQISIYAAMSDDRQ